MHDLPLYLLASDRPLINIDGTLFINIGLWLVLFFILRGLLWRPMLRLITAREKGTQGSRDDARHLEADAKAKRAEFEAAQRRARAAAIEERDKLRAEGQKIEAQVLAEARETLGTELEKQRAELRVQRDALRTEMRAMVPALATQIATKILGREVQT
jgi:F-type H+-transporting ATPase subunit b